MTAAREALLLPLVFLTVVLLAGLQIGEPPASPHRRSLRWCWHAW